MSAAANLRLCLALGGARRALTPREKEFRRSGLTILIHPDTFDEAHVLGATRSIYPAALPLQMKLIAPHS